MRVRATLWPSTSPSTSCLYIFPYICCQSPHALRAKAAFLLIDRLLWIRFWFRFRFQFRFHYGVLGLGYGFSFVFIYSTISFTVSLAVPHTHAFVSMLFAPSPCFLPSRFFYYYLLLPCLRLVLILDEWNNFYWFQILTLFYAAPLRRVFAGCVCCSTIYVWVCVRSSACVCVLLALYAYFAASHKRKTKKKLQDAAKAHRLHLPCAPLPRASSHAQTTKCGKYFTMTLLLNRHVYELLLLSVCASVCVRVSAAFAQSVAECGEFAAAPFAIQHVC